MGRFVYTVGERFNEIELVRQESRTWVCRCHCGNEFKPRNLYALRIGKLKSCGCTIAEQFSYAPGQRFHDIEVLRHVVGGWVCRCHCGKEFTAENITKLRLGQLRSCGCINVTFIAGQRYSDIELVRLEPDGWVCRCHCGKEFTPKSIGQLRAGRLKSCGCLKEKLRTRDPLFPQYFSHRYHLQKGRFCEEWATFEGFKQDMKETFFEGAKLDRYDLANGFSRKNCFWSSVEEYDKRRGRRNTRPIVKCACGNEFRQQTRGDIHCSQLCRRNHGGVLNSILSLSPQQILEMKAEILGGPRGYGQRLANKHGLTLTQVWAFSKRIRAEAQ